MRIFRTHLGSDSCWSSRFPMSYSYLISGYLSISFNSLFWSRLNRLPFSWGWTLGKISSTRHPRWEKMPWRFSPKDNMFLLQKDGLSVIRSLDLGRNCGYGDMRGLRDRLGQESVIVSGGPYGDGYNSQISRGKKQVLEPEWLEIFLLEKFRLERRNNWLRIMDEG